MTITMADMLDANTSVATPDPDWTLLTSKCEHCGRAIMVNVSTHAKSVRFMGSWFHKHNHSERCDD
jgi:hypothetical protein